MMIPTMMQQQYYPYPYPMQMMYMPYEMDYGSYGRKVVAFDG